MNPEVKTLEALVLKLKNDRFILLNRHSKIAANLRMLEFRMAYEEDKLATALEVDELETPKP